MDDPDVRHVDVAVSLGLHRAAQDLARTATDYDLCADRMRVLDALADVCRRLDGVAADIWLSALSRDRAELSGEPVTTLCEELCELLRQRGAAAPGGAADLTATCCTTDPGRDQP